MSGNTIGNNGGRLYSFGSQPVLIDCNFVVDPANGTGMGIRNLKGQGVQNVYMHSTAPASSNPNPTPGYAWIQLASNYNRYLGGFSGFVSPVVGSPLAINAASAALSVHSPYIITSVGAGPSGVVTISPVADIAGSLAGKYFSLFDSYGNTFVIWFNVSGVGVAPQLGSPAPVGQRGLQYVQQSIAANSSAATIGAALVLTIENLPSGISGTFAFTASGTSTVTVTSTAALPVAGIPMDGSTVIPEHGPAVPIIFTIAPGSASANSIWTDGSGHLYTVTTSVVAGTTLVTSGVGAPIGSVLSFVSGPGSTVALSFTNAVTGYATGFGFAVITSDTNLQDWQSVGLPKGLNPSVGQSFIAKATGAGSSSGLVMAPGVSDIVSMEVIGDPNASFAPMPQGGSPFVGSWIMVQMLGLPASGQVPVATAPATGSVVGLSFYVDAKFSPSNVGF